MCYTIMILFFAFLYTSHFVKNNNVAIVNEKISFIVYFMSIKDESL
jgi:hypothetical protein